MHLAVGQVQAVVLVVLRFGKLLRVLGRCGVRRCALRERVSGTEVCDELCGIFRGVYSERLGDCEKGGGKCGNGELFTRALECVSLCV